MDQYNVEMDERDHVDLLQALLAHRGPVMISGYDAPLYNDMLQGWAKDAKPTLAEKGTRKTEVLWTNFKTQLSLWD